MDIFFVVAASTLIVVKEWLRLLAEASRTRCAEERELHFRCDLDRSRVPAKLSMHVIHSPLNRNAVAGRSSAKARKALTFEDY